MSNRTFKRTTENLLAPSNNPSMVLQSTRFKLPPPGMQGYQTVRSLLQNSGQSIVLELRLR
jgi:hypothetical protein